MSEARMWIIEVSDRGKDKWMPMAGESFLSEKVARSVLVSFQEPYRKHWEYRVTKYTPEAP